MSEKKIFRAPGFREVDPPESPRRQHPRQVVTQRIHGLVGGPTYRSSNEISRMDITVKSLGADDERLLTPEENNVLMKLLTSGERPTDEAIGSCHTSLLPDSLGSSSSCVKKNSTSTIW